MEQSPIKVAESSSLADFETQVGKATSDPILLGVSGSSPISSGVIFPNYFCDSMIKMVRLHQSLYIGSL